MTHWVDSIMVVIILMNLAILASSRISSCIRLVAFQGVVLGILPLIINDNYFTMHSVFLSVATITLKGIVFPWLLFRAMREANVHHEVEPLVGYSVSIFIGILALIVSIWLSSRLPVPGERSTFVIPVSFSTIIVGLFVIISRVKALNQVLGYLVLENGIYSFGTALLFEQPLLIELGILLDIFVAVFVMGITIFHISREFDHIDTDHLSELADWVPNNSKGKR